MIDIQELTFQYEHGDREALKNVSLQIPDSGFLGIIGPSGAGKSTLLNAINGIIPHHYKGAYYGCVRINGADTFELGLTDISLMVGTVFQDIDSQMIAAEVENELLFGLENFGVPREEIEPRMESTLEQIGISDLRCREIHTLSGGQKQKVAIAAIVAMRPNIILLDEPTGELDPGSSRQIYAMLKKLNEQYGMTVVVVEQKIMLLSEFCTDLAVMSCGALAYHGPVREVLAHSEELEELGINCPRVVTLSAAMQKAGMTDGEISIRVDEAEQMVRKALP